MAWARLDDGFGDHQKVLDLIDTLPELEGAAAIGLWTLALAYANKARRLAKVPGFIPRSFARSRARVPPQIGDRLVDVGLWEEAEGGWLIHDFDEYLPSEELRAKRAEAGRQGARARWEKKTSAQEDAEQSTEGERAGSDSNLPSEATMANGKSCPIPEPIPIKKTSSSSAPRKRSTKQPEPEHPLFAEFWKAYPRREGKAKAREAFTEAINGGATPEVLVSAASRYALHHARVKTERGYIAHPTTWLNQERWEDDYGDQPGSNEPPPPPPHCGVCDLPDRTIELHDGSLVRCPDCHPDAERNRR